MSSQESQYDFSDIERDFFAEAACSIVEGREMQAQLRLSPLETGLKTYIESLFGLIDLNPQLNELIDESMKAVAAVLSSDLKNRLADRSMTLAQLIDASGVPEYLIEILLEGKSLPSLLLLHKIAKTLHCELRLDCYSLTSNERFNASFLPEDSSRELSREIGLLLDSLKLRLSAGKFCFCLQSSNAEEFPLDYALSTQVLFSRLAARLYRLEMRFLPSLESTVHDSFVY